MKRALFLLFVTGGMAFTSCKNNTAGNAETGNTATTESTTGAVTAPAATTDNVTVPATEQTTTTTTNAAPPAMPGAKAGTSATTAAPAPAEADVTAKPTGPLTSIKFEKTEFDFGTVKDGEKVKHVFKFTNTGKEPLIISDAKATCGCTVPVWPKEPIAPGKSSEIKVEFDSKGKGTEEGAPQLKKVTITANTDPVSNYLTIKGNVKK